MQDTGLAALYDKFCETYGQATGKVILGLVGLSVVVVALGFIFSGVFAAYEYLSELVFESGEPKPFYEAIFITLTTLAAVVVAANFAFRISHGPAHNHLRQLIDRAGSAADRAAATIEEADEVLKFASSRQKELDDRLDQLEDVAGYVADLVAAVERDELAKFREEARVPRSLRWNEGTDKTPATSPVPKDR